MLSATTSDTSATTVTGATPRCPCPLQKLSLTSSHGVSPPPATSHNGSLSPEPGLEPEDDDGEVTAVTLCPPCPHGVTSLSPRCHLPVPSLSPLYLLTVPTIPRVPRSPTHPSRTLVAACGSGIWPSAFRARLRTSRSCTGCSTRLCWSASPSRRECPSRGVPDSRRNSRIPTDPRAPAG